MFLRLLGYLSSYGVFSRFFCTSASELQLLKLHLNEPVSAQKISGTPNTAFGKGDKSSLEFQDLTLSECRKLSSPEI